jgi:hypothetical protein
LLAPIDNETHEECVSLSIGAKREREGRDLLRRRRKSVAYTTISGCLAAVLPPSSKMNVSFA